MSVILDIHTHHAALEPEAVISTSPWVLPTEGSQCFSIGIHPWDTADMPDQQKWHALEEAALRNDVRLIGECGIDTLRGGPMFQQLIIFRRHIELSERVGKPLIIHDVKAHDIIIGVKNEMKPKMPWIIHGFRGKPTVAAMLLRAGCYLSYGEHFNPDSLRATPLDRLLAETDDSHLDIHAIISSLEQAAGVPLLSHITDTTSHLLEI